MSGVSLDVMHSKPGIYAIVAPVGLGFVEVDHEGRCWQLRFTDFSRDGGLIAGNWNPQNILAIAGPLMRPGDMPKPKQGLVSVLRKYILRR